MSGATWMVETLEGPPRSGPDAVVWVVRVDGPQARQALARIRPTRADLADAALAREDGGAGRLLRRRLLRALAGQVFGRHPEELRIERTEAGALILPDLDARASVAGSGDHAALAVGRGALGVDLEAAAPDSPGLADWTAREAYVKALGVGWRMAPEAIGLNAAADAFRATATGWAAGAGQWLRRPGLIAALVRLDGDV